LYKFFFDGLTDICKNLSDICVVFGTTLNEGNAVLASKRSTLRKGYLPLSFFAIDLIPHNYLAH
jgi:hypothetical protein